MAHDHGKWSRLILGLNVQGDIGPMTCYTSKRGKFVAFPRAPPLNPPSPTQEIFRDFIRLCATTWRASGPSNRNNWQAACDRANLWISGYNLWVWYSRTHEEAGLRTIERKSGIALDRPP